MGTTQQLFCQALHYWRIFIVYATIMSFTKVFLLMTLTVMAASVSAQKFNRPNVPKVPDVKVKVPENYNKLTENLMNQCIDENALDDLTAKGSNHSCSCLTSDVTTGGSCS